MAPHEGAAVTNRLAPDTLRMQKPRMFPLAQVHMQEQVEEATQCLTGTQPGHQAALCPTLQPYSGGELWERGPLPSKSVHHVDSRRTQISKLAGVAMVGDKGGKDKDHAP